MNVGLGLYIKIVHHNSQKYWQDFFLKFSWAVWQLIINLHSDCKDSPLNCQTSSELYGVHTPCTLRLCAASMVWSENCSVYLHLYASDDLYQATYIHEQKHMACSAGIV